MLKFSIWDKILSLQEGHTHKNSILSFDMPCYNILGRSCAAICITPDPQLLSFVANPPHPYPLPSLSLCAVPRVRGSGWILRRWRLAMTVRWTKLSPGAGPSRICTRTAAIRWCALRGNPSSGMYCVYGLLVLAAVHCLALKC